jgi:hypothetical protein
MNSTVRALRDRLEGLYEIGHKALVAGEVEDTADVLGAIERIEKVTLPQAQAEARAERAERHAERVADPDRLPAVVAEGAPAGWVDGPDDMRARMSPVLRRRLALAEQAETTLAEQAKAEREAQAEVVREAAALQSWRSDAALGLVDVGDWPRYQNGTAGGHTPGEALAAFAAVQDQEDRARSRAAARYGEMCLQRFGIDGDKALEALLYGAGKVPAGPAGPARSRERGA